MAGTARKSDPALWDKVKAAVTASDAGGKPGQWSARKAQLATAEYQKQGGSYRGPKQADNHLAEWTREDWGTRSGKSSLDSGERYLPRAARKALTADEYGRSSARKRQDLAAGRQVSAQPADVARKTAAARRKPPTGKGKDMGESDLHHGTGAGEDTGAEFRRLVNIPAAELRPWLDTWESQAVGFTRAGEEEAVGHRSGRRILELLEGDGDDAEADMTFRRQVVGYIHRHLAQRPDGDVTDTRWRHSLMNWGHDPMRDTSEGTTMNSEDTNPAAAPAPRKPRARRAAAPADGLAPVRKPRAAKPTAAASPARKPARGTLAVQSEGGRKGSSTRSPAKAATARGNGAKGGAARSATASRSAARTARRGVAAAPKRATAGTAKAGAAKRATGTATKRAAATPAKRATGLTTKRATTAPAKRATTAPAKRAAAPAKRVAAPAKRATGAATKRVAAPAKRAAATPAKRATGTAAKRSAAPVKRAAGTATKRTAAAAPKRGAAQATTAAPKRAAAGAAKAKPATRGAAGRTAGAAKGGRASSPRSRGRD